MKYAIIESGGKQYKAVEGETIEVDRLHLEAGKSHKLEGVLLLVDGDKITVGTPLIAGMSVNAKVVEHFKGEKSVNFHYKPKKRIRQKTGHRQQYTRLEIKKLETKKSSESEEK
jgi:large subunit ribosomal protein L21